MSKSSERLPIITGENNRMAYEWDQRKTSLYAFKQDLDTYGYVSLLTLATWNNKFPPQKGRLQAKKTHSLSTQAPLSKEKKGE